MQSGKRQMRLGLHAGGREQRQTAVACRSGGLGEQPGLPDARLAAKHERLTALGDPVQERREELLFPARPRRGAASSRAVPSIVAASSHPE